MAGPEHQNPCHFGLVVGIDHYPDKTLGSLKHARRDARGFYEWLTHPDKGSVPPKNCEQVILDDKDLPPHNPDDDDETRRQRAIPKLQRLHEAVKAVERRGDALYERDRKAWERSRLYYYVAGHGIAGEPTDALFLAADAGLGWWGLHVSCKNILNYFLRLQTFREVVLFADCCRSIQAGVPTQPLPFDTGASRKRKGVRSAVCFGALFGQQAWEPSDADQRRGYFTEALLQGLEGAADPEGQSIHSTNLAVYVGQRVEALTAGRQKAEFRPDPSDPILFRTTLPAAPPAVYKVVLNFGGFAGMVQLRDGKRLLVGAPRPIARGEEWELQLSTGLYEVESVPSEAAAFASDGLFKVAGDRRVQL